MEWSRIDSLFVVYFPVKGIKWTKKDQSGLNNQNGLNRPKQTKVNWSEVNESK